MTIAFLSGVLTFGYAVAALYFLRFWRESRDPLFGWFAAAFALLFALRYGISLIRSPQSQAATARPPEVTA